MQIGLAKSNVQTSQLIMVDFIAVSTIMKLEQRLGLTIPKGYFLNQHSNLILEAYSEIERGGLVEEVTEKLTLIITETMKNEQFKEYFEGKIQIANKTGRYNEAIEKLNIFAEWVIRALDHCERDLLFVCNTFAPYVFCQERFISKLEKYARESKRFCFITGKQIKGEEKYNEDKNDFIEFLKRVEKDDILSRNIKTYIQKDLPPFLHYFVVDHKAALVEALHKPDEPKRYFSLFCARKTISQKYISILRERTQFQLDLGKNVSCSHPEDYEIVRNINILEEKEYKNRRYEEIKNDKSAYKWVNDSMKFEDRRVNSIRKNKEYNYLKRIVEKVDSLENELRALSGIKDLNGRLETISLQNDKIFKILNPNDEKDATKSIDITIRFVSYNEYITATDLLQDMGIYFSPLGLGAISINKKNIQMLKDKYYFNFEEIADLNKLYEDIEIKQKYLTEMRETKKS